MNHGIETGNEEWFPTSRMTDRSGSGAFDHWGGECLFRSDHCQPYFDIWETQNGSEPNQVRVFVESDWKISERDDHYSHCDRSNYSSILYSSPCQILMTYVIVIGATYL